MCVCKMKDKKQNKNCEKKNRKKDMESPFVVAVFG